MSEEQKAKIKHFIFNAMRDAVQCERDELSFSEHVEQWNSILDDAMDDIKKVLEASS